MTQQKQDDDILISIGTQLRQARQAQALSLDDVSKKTCISESYLQAIEQADRQTLPEQVYILAFVRQYADAVQLDLSDETEQLGHYEYALKTPFTMPDPAITPTKPWAIYIAALFVLLFIVANLWFQRAPQPEQQITENSQPPSSLEIQQAGHTKPIQAPASSKHPKDLPPSQAPIVETQTNSAPLTTPSNKAHDTTIPTPKPSQTNSSTAAQDNTAVRLRFFAKDKDVWFQIKDKDKHIVHEALLHAGESSNISLSMPAFLTCGNAGSLGIAANEKIIVTAGSLGAIGKVLHHLPIQDMLDKASNTAH